MNKRSGIRALVLLVMMASMVVSSGCTDIAEYLVCGENAYWKFSKFRCMDHPDPEKVKEYREARVKCEEEAGEWIDETDKCSYAAKNKEAHGQCVKAGGEWMPWTNACSVPTKNKEETKAHKCEEEGGEWVTWTNACSIPTKNKEKAAGDNAAATPDKLPDKSDTK